MRSIVPGIQYAGVFSALFCKCIKGVWVICRGSFYVGNCGTFRHVTEEFDKPLWEKPEKGSCDASDRAGLREGAIILHGLLRLYGAGNLQL